MWLNILKEEDILEIPDVTSFYSGPLSSDQIAEKLSHLTFDPLDSFKPRLTTKIRHQFINEFLDLICTHDSKYKSLRKKLTHSSHESSTVIISLISATLAANVGVEVGSMVGLCAILLYAVIKLGVDSFCQVMRPSKL